MNQRDDYTDIEKLVNLANKLFTDSKIKDVFFVLNKIPDKETESYLREKLTQKGIEPMASIPEDAAIPVSWLKGTQLQAENLFDEAQKIIERLEKVPIAACTVVVASLLACLVTTFGIFTINRYEQWGSDNVTYLMSFAAGVLISVSFTHIINISSSTLGALIALSAGALVYVGASHLLPAVEREEKRYSLVALAIGVLIAAIIVISK